MMQLSCLSILCPYRLFVSFLPSCVLHILSYPSSLSHDCWSALSPLTIAIATEAHQAEVLSWDVLSESLVGEIHECIKGHPPSTATDRLAPRKGPSGVLHTWGRADHGRIAHATDTFLPTPVAGLRRVRHVASGFQHVAVLCEDGSVMAWGKGEFGALGQGEDVSDQWEPVVVPGLPSDVRRVYAGQAMTAALTGTCVRACVTIRISMATKRPLAEMADSRESSSLN
jgi:alpha-tubulin suppressor-like RCC1 family protein